jgi:hypothetical protein
MVMHRSDKHTLPYSLLIVICLGISLFCLAYPFYVIRPFRPQGVRELSLALAVLRMRTYVLAVCAAAALFGAVRYWHARPRLWRRIAAVAGVVVVFVCAALSRVNIYEMMFHPVGQPSFASVDQTKLDGDEMVIAVTLSGAGRAYPVRIVSYHHVVNDVVDGVPIVATY